MAKGIAKFKMLLSLIDKNRISRERKAKRKIKVDKKILKRSIRRIKKLKGKISQKKTVRSNLLDLI